MIEIIVCFNFFSFGGRYFIVVENKFICNKFLRVQCSISFMYIVWNLFSFDAVFGMNSYFILNS